MSQASLARMCMLVLALVAGGGTSVSAAPKSADPSTFLYDAPGGPGEAAAEKWLARVDLWARLEEDDKTHAFRGIPVLMNDKIVAVLEAGTPAMAVYSRQTSGAKLCARLQPVCGQSTEFNRASVAIKENTRTSVSLEVTFRSGGEVRQITYEVSAGQPFVKVSGGTGVERLRVLAPCRFAVLPDFFADDIVFDASTVAIDQAELPSENFLLHMIPGGEAIVMTVSESRDNDVVVRLAGKENRQIISSDIFFGKKPRIWVTVLAGQEIWHQCTVTPADAGKELRMEWQMPFPALWRVDWSKTDGLAESWEMLLQDPSGKYVMQNWFGQKESEGQSFGNEFGPRDWNKPNRQRWNPVLGGFKFPCWVDNDRSAHLQPLDVKKKKELAGYAGPVLIYPIDRVQAAPFITPLQQLTIVDLVRTTLGVGPCQYILDLEGQKRNSRGVATCYARDVINAIYKEGTQLRQGPAIGEHLDLCVAFIRNVRERIDQYVQFGHEMNQFLEAQKRETPAKAKFIDEMIGVNKKLDLLFEQGREKIRTPVIAQQTAAEFRTNLLTYAEKDAYDKCAKQMAIFTSIGGAQDDLVASCRMIVKTLRQRSGIAMAINPELKGIATEIRQRTQVMLRNATPYEAPRH